MNHTLKRIGRVVLLLTVAALLGCAWAAAEDAQGGDFGDGLHWQLSGDGLLEITGAGDMPDFEDMDSRPWIDVLTGIGRIRIGEGVTGIGSNAFFSCSNLVSVELPDSLTRIGQQAFSDCIKLTGITIPAGVTTIGHMPFSESDALQAITVEDGNVAYSSVDGVLYNQDGSLLIAYPGGKTGAFTVPAGVEDIEQNAFLGCQGISEVTISEGVTRIRGTAFGYSSLTRVIIPQSMRYIEYQVFEGCESLEEIRVAEGNNWYLSEDGALFDKDKTKLIAFPAQKTGTYRVPDGVTRIQDSAFAGSRLSEVILPASLTYIGYTAFAECDNLAEVWYMGNREAWGRVEIIECNFSLDTATIHCLELSGQCGENATYMMWDDRLYVDGTGDMYDYSLAGQAPWRWYQFDQVYVAEGITSIGNWAFRYVQNMTEMLIPSTVTRIGVNAFDGCSKMESITIPAAVTRIDENAFMYCNALQTVYYGGSRVQWDAIEIVETGNETLLAANVVYTETFSGTCGENVIWTLRENGTLTISGTGDMDDTYDFEEPAPWMPYAEMIRKVVVEEGVTSVSGYTFPQCEHLTEVTLAGSVVNIGDRAFDDCILLGTVHFAEGLTSIGYSAFEGCEALRSVTLPASLRSIGEAAFASCGLTGVQVPAGTETARYYFFGPQLSENEVVIHVDLPIGVEVDFGAFSWNSLPVEEPDLVLPADLTAVEAEAFRNTGARFVWLPEGVESIASHAFADCEDLELIYIPDSCESIGEGIIPRWTAIVTLRAEDDGDNAATIYARENGIPLIRYEDPFSGNG